MKNILLIATILFVASCHKKDNSAATIPPVPVNTVTPVPVNTITPVPVNTVTPTPPTNDSRLVRAWTNNVVIITFTKDSMSYNTNSPVLLNSNWHNKSYTLHDTLYINSKSCYKIRFSGDSVYLRFLTNTSIGYDAGCLIKY